MMDMFIIMIVATVLKFEIGQMYSLSMWFIVSYISINEKDKSKINCESDSVLLLANNGQALI